MIAETMPLDWLNKRGILPETASRYRLQVTNYKGRSALIYPTYGERSIVGWRVRYTDTNKPKYEWKEHHEENRYYSPVMFQEAIEANGGVLYILNGEPAIWAHHSYQVARGKDKDLAAPSLAWFGEGNVPHTLADDLKSWQVNRVFVFPDCDEAGYKSALKIQQQLNGVLEVALVDLPFAYGSKKDFNDLWLEMGCNPASMKPLKPLTLDTIFERAPHLRPQPVTLNQPFRREMPETTIDYRALQHQWVDELISALGAPAKREGRIDRWHCPVHSPDNDPSFRIEYKPGELPRPRCTCGIHDDPNAWDTIARALHLSTWEEYKPQHLPKPALKIVQAQPMPAPLPKNAVHVGDTSLQNVLSIIRGDLSKIGNHVTFPYTALHSIGGLCHHVPSGKLVNVIGASGEGKTSFIEGGNDALNRSGVDVIFFSPEWTPDEIAKRRIQRYSGRNGNPHVTVNDIVAHELWLKEQQLGIPEQQRSGQPLSAMQVAELERIVRYLSLYPGRLHNVFIDGGTVYLEDFLQLTADTIATGRAEQRRMDVVVFDYVQLAQLKSNVPDGTNATEHAISLIKAHALQHKYVGFIASQVTKASSKASKTEGAMLTSDDAMQIRSDKFNLVLTLNREYVEEMSEETGLMEHKPTGFGFVYVDKNSLGLSRKRVKLVTDLAHYTWQDKAIDG